MQKIKCLTNGIANTKITNMIKVIIGIIITLSVLILFNILVVRVDKKRKSDENSEAQKPTKK